MGSRQYCETFRVPLRYVLLIRPRQWPPQEDSVFPYVVCSLVIATWIAFKTSGDQ